MENVTVRGEVLARPRSVTTAEVGGTTYLFVSTTTDRIEVLSVASDGGLSPVGNVKDDGSLQINTPVSVTTAEVGGTTYLFVAGQDDNGVSVFSVGNNGRLSNVANVSDDSSLELNGSVLCYHCEGGGATYLLSPGLMTMG